MFNFITVQSIAGYHVVFVWFFFFCHCLLSSCCCHNSFLPAAYDLGNIASMGTPTSTDSIQCHNIFHVLFSSDHAVIKGKIMITGTLVYHIQDILVMCLVTFYFLVQAPMNWQFFDLQTPKNFKAWHVLPPNIVFRCFCLVVLEDLHCMLEISCDTLFHLVCKQCSDMQRRVVVVWSRAKLWSCIVLPWVGIGFTVLVWGFEVVPDALMPKALVQKIEEVVL